MEDIKEELKKDYIKEYKTKMKKLTLKNLYNLIYLKCIYIEKCNNNIYDGYILNKINNFINYVINTNKNYYNILSDYYNKNLLDNNDLKFLM